MLHVHRFVIAIATAGCGVTAIRPATPPPSIATAPAFSLVSHRGEIVRKHEVLDKSHAVLVFYRGHW
jgi:hypothetical protein